MITTTTSIGPGSLPYQRQPKLKAKARLCSVTEYKVSSSTRFFKTEIKPFTYDFMTLEFDYIMPSGCKNCHKAT